VAANSSSRRVLSGVLALGLVAGGWWYWSAHAADQAKGNREKPNQSIAVHSTLALKRDVAETLSMSGFVTPLQTVDIRSQVVATVQAVHVAEGQSVKAGQNLFSLDDRGASADSDKLVAQVAKDQALLDDAQRNLTRNRELLAKNFVAKSVVDSAQSNVDAAQATLKADRAALASGRVALDYRRITAPIAGRVGEIKVHLGSLVQPSGVDAMTTVTQMDPINVTFNIPERNVAALVAEQRSGPVVVSVKAGSEKLEGKLSFIDNTIDPTSGSLKARAVFANTESVLWPGALVDVALALHSRNGAIVIPPRAIQVGPAGQFVYVIGADSTVSPQAVTIDYLTTDQAVVSGLNEGSRVVTEGGQNLRPGLKVTEARDDAGDQANGKPGKSASSTEGAQ